MFSVAFYNFIHLDLDLGSPYIYCRFLNKIAGYWNLSVNVITFGLARIDQGKRLFLYMFPSPLAWAAFLINSKPRIQKPTFWAQISLKKSSFPSLFTVFKAANSKHREYQNRGKRGPTVYISFERGRAFPKETIR